MARKMGDYLRDGSNDLMIRGGDFVVGESTPAHQMSLLLDTKGEYKEHPTVCVGIVNYEDSENPEDLIREISTQFMQDGMTFKKLEFNPISLSDNTVAPFVSAVYK